MTKLGEKRAIKKDFAASYWNWRRWTHRLNDRTFDYGCRGCLREDATNLVMWRFWNGHRSKVGYKILARRVLVYSILLGFVFLCFMKGLKIL